MALNTDHVFHFTVNVRIPESEVQTACGELMDELKVDHNQAMSLLKHSVGVALQEETNKSFRPLKAAHKPASQKPTEKAG